LVPQRCDLWKPLLVGVVAVGVLAPGTAAAAAPSAGQLAQQIQAQSAQFEKIVEQYNRIGEELKATQAAIGALRKRLGPVQAQLDSATDRVDRIAAEAYKGGTLAEFSAVVGAPDTSTVVQRLVTISQLSAYENRQVTAAIDARAVQTAQLARLNALLTDQQRKHATLADQKKKINAQLGTLYALRAKLYGSATTYTGSGRVTSGAGTPAPYVPGRAGVAVKFAYAQLGKPYRWAAAGPSSYDCSGLTMAAWKTAGVSLPHNAAMQWGVVSHLTRGALQPGDLVFYSGLGHVAIYVGGGRIIHSPQPGEVVSLASIDIMTPYGYGRPG
jgi:cell wall-associated NlpC family hydrolase